MPGNFQRHLEEFGNCQCDNRSGIEYMDLEVEEQVAPGHTKFIQRKMPACADCFGLI